MHHVSPRCTSNLSGSSSTKTCNPIKCNGEERRTKARTLKHSEREIAERLQQLESREAGERLLRETLTNRADFFSSPFSGTRLSSASGRRLWKIPLSRAFARMQYEEIILTVTRDSSSDQTLMMTFLSKASSSDVLYEARAAFLPNHPLMFQGLDSWTLTMGIAALSTEHRWTH